jgi:hypothetical protein
MKALNTTSTKTFQKIIAKLNGDSHLKIDVNGRDSGIMPLVVEKLGQPIDFLSAPHQIYSFAHYYTQNGDLVSDPDMTFAVNINHPEFVIPFTFQDSFKYSEAIFIREGRWIIKERLQADLASFANSWMKNIRWQQNL